ncbi:hypothetical protein H5410_008680 [Solanum commersonii]|uniref:Uncharacterized protein n=1 Tax=Solanum commersonii TaxID=4109 RepID=A0A9J6AFM6_SOLCO|nr:hypothetical protein H5410_008680 [Solanum commersonii]
MSELCELEKKKKDRERRKKEALHDREGTLPLGNRLFAFSERPGSELELGERKRTSPLHQWCG